MLRLKKDDMTLKLEWTNWDEGSFDGPEELVHALSVRYALR